MVPWPIHQLCTIKHLKYAVLWKPPSVYSRVVMGESLPKLPRKFVSDNYSAHLQKYQKFPQIQSQTI